MFDSHTFFLQLVRIVRRVKAEICESEPTEINIIRLGFKIRHQNEGNTTPYYPSQFTATYMPN